MNAHENITLADALTTLAETSAGHPFPDDAIDRVGGWGRITQDAASLAGKPALPLLAQLAARDAGDTPHEHAVAALTAVAESVMATREPTLMRESLDALTAAKGAIRATGRLLATTLPSVVESILNDAQRDKASDLVAADALEVLTKVVASGYGSHFGLLALLDRFDAPMNLPIARAAIRSVSVAADIWPEADVLAVRIRGLAALDPTESSNSELAGAVEPDAVWALAMMSISRALRANTIIDMAPHLDEADRYLDVAATNHGRADAAVMRQVLSALQQLVAAIVAETPLRALHSAALSPSTIEEVRTRIRQFTTDTAGLDHWYGDRTRAVLAAWAGVIDDLDRLRAEFTKDAFYQAEVIVSDLLNVYLHSRSFEVHYSDLDVGGVQKLIHPVIESGFASKAGHLSNLEQHADNLEGRVAVEPDEGLEEQLKAARKVIDAARRAARGGELPGKAPGGASAPPLPAPISQLVVAGSPDEALLRQISPDTLAALAVGMEHIDAGRAHLNMVQREVYDGIREKFKECPDYRGEVIPVVDEVLRLVLNFVVSRTAGESGHYPYLFDPSAVESAIQEDLYNYLVAALGARAEYEVSHVGGGRVDLRLKFGDFAIHIEMKVDDTQVPMSDKSAYLKQAATYQGNDIRIGFLIALRHKAFPKGPPPHLTSLMQHTAFDIPSDPVPRHIVTVAVPGSRTKPSDSTVK
ncbi:hypothetical protein [Mycobacterium sp. GA-2829]|uniref:hypothetical protein n=1 Tax=Mycobacterium sp. GA-2829 TaxID=1772283 RepID=UPI000AA835E0|nr:hypothetical protein [Mycobacterium sp. GA-2829]